ncbi:response regulator transcription factor [Clostridium algidicarnis]|uniref:Stage 0 sporulation protein A homolog n=2 Tax=Clostridium algidicarnis TaxID=37659 RepID=A0A2S6FYW6_9CLOT|nr:response regulator transcription factor [Clostridium algidicarnis]MBB6630045.1 response regulator transcription factor [Clostridium algidicarnis]MBB6696951.1 response regulator transcription factor [Clostridium algidicarnis]MBU3193300.1 response regulator transcription factor [Clostridium algidicarnis]MBU3196981.1 response regulator transcription factor [Clostridium algidicarnis]MBU3204656.1 response regulator transcription factor [Clostridium algidicarnis]
MSKVLIVEDEENIRSFIKINLNISGFEVREAGSGEEALIICEKEKLDLIILDIMLPGIDGYKTCELIRKDNPEVAIIMLTAKNQDMDKIIGLELGADDYITKPFNPTELIYRIKAILRRSGGATKEDKEKIVFNGPLSLDDRSQKVFIEEDEVKLTLKEFQIIKLFMYNLDRAFSRDELLDNIWGEDFYGDIKTVDVHIRRLREKIEEDPSKPKYIETVWGYGYRFKKV